MKNRKSMLFWGFFLGLLIVFPLLLMTSLSYTIENDLKIQPIPYNLPSPDNFTESFSVLTPQNVMRIQEIAELSTGNINLPLVDLAQAPNSEELVVLYKGGTFQRWNMATKNLMAEYDFGYAEIHAGNFTRDGSLVFTPGGTVTGYDIGDLLGYIIWNLETGTPEFCASPNCSIIGKINPRLPYENAFIDPTGKFLVEYSLIGFNVNDLNGNPSVGHAMSSNMMDESIKIMAMDNSGEYFAYAFESGSIYVESIERAYSLSNFDKKNFRLNHDPKYWIDLEFDETLNWLAILDDQKASVFDLGKVFSTLFFEIDIDDGNVIRFDRTGKLLIIGTKNGLDIYEIETNTKLGIFEGFDVTSIYISNDNRLLIWGDSKGAIHIWVVPQS